ncbi:MAG TPA: ribokinase [Cyanobacteria bacterium UBA9273]|nr:ribokinase [Cyanobacteria bacterium UBA9273]
MAKNGLFIGMVTLDLIYLSPKLPAQNEKIAASDYTVSAGGPATNAAVTFGALGNRSTILGVLGTHPITQLVRSDVEEYGVTIADLNPTATQPPPISSIIVTQGTGDRAVISMNAAKIQASSDRVPAGIDTGVDIVMIDGHQMAVSRAIAQSAKANHIPVVIDGGSWKPGFDTILPYVDYAICSANFYPPGCCSCEDVLAYLVAAGIPHIAITQGEQPIQYLSLGESGQLPVPQVNIVDTLGAGDIFHGAFCHYILHHPFTNALKAAANIAAHSCQFFGTRQGLAENSKRKDGEA